jgi:hypothetical protein
MPARGPYTFDELKAVLYSAADPLYLDPFFEGQYGNGRELFEALIEVLRRVDDAINHTTQGMFISPWSGQTGEPAAGASRTILTMEFRRIDKLLGMPLTLRAGEVLYEERTTDYARNGGVEVLTGRTYTLIDDVCFLPGQSGPIAANVVATRVGFGYGNVEPGDVTYIQQPGLTLTNVGATINIPAPTSPYDRMAMPMVPDVLSSAQIGQYVQFVTGANAGQIRRLTAFEPDNSGATGGVAVFAREPVLKNAGLWVTVPFIVEEYVEQYNGAALLARGRVLTFQAGAPTSLVVETVYGAFAATGGPVTVVTGVESGATLSINTIDGGTALTPELATAAWAVQEWAGAFGVAVTNIALVERGEMGVLDAIGAERGISRSPGEDDESYRARVKAIADTVSPNAIRRIGNRIWSIYGGSVCLREVGQRLLPGVYCDATSTPPLASNSYAYDLDGIVVTGIGIGQFIDGERVYQVNGGVITTGRYTTTIPAAALGALVPPPVAQLEIANIRGPGFVNTLPIVGETSLAVWTPAAITGGLRNENRFKLNLDYTDMRAFFLVGVPASDLGDFGIAYDSGTHNAFDANPYLAFCDGFAATAAVLNRSTWQGINEAKAGGVGFDLYIEAIGCS